MFYFCGMVTNRLKGLIFKKLYDNLSNAEIISHNDSIWFIDREKEYWYFQLTKNGCLWWRHDFFVSFFPLFSLEESQFRDIISEWVEEVLNCRVITTTCYPYNFIRVVKEVLNCKVITTGFYFLTGQYLVKEVLNCRVITTVIEGHGGGGLVKEVLNCRVITTRRNVFTTVSQVKEVLNSKVITKNNDWV